MWFRFSVDFLSSPGFATLAALLDRVGALPPTAARHISRKVLGALGELHAAGFVMATLSPETVLVHLSGCVKLLVPSPLLLSADGTCAPLPARSPSFTPSLPYMSPALLASCAQVLLRL